MTTDMLTTAADNREAVKGLLRGLDLAVEDAGYEYVAELLDTNVTDLRSKLDGDKELTLTGLRQIAIAAGVSVHFDVIASHLVGV